MTFAALLVTQKRDKKKSFFMILRGRTMFAPTMQVVAGMNQCTQCVGVAETGKEIFKREESPLK